MATDVIPAMERDMKLTVLLGLSAIGLIVALYQTYEHYVLTSAICDLSATFSCSAVTASRFGEFPPRSGIATAFWGVLWWVSILVLGYGVKQGKKWLPDLEFALFADTVFGLGFVIYLLTVELYILPQETGELVICPFCTIQHILIVILLPLTYSLLHKPVRTSLEHIFYQEA